MNSTHKKYVAACDNLAAAVALQTMHVIYITTGSIKVSTHGKHVPLVGSKR